MPQSAAIQKEKFNLKNTVLLVDDDRVLRLMMAKQLEQMGYNVVEAENGQIALDVLIQKSEMIDVIILDRQMPVMDGFGFMEKIGQHDILKNKIIIMLTGHSHPSQVTEGVMAGVFYYLVKPVNYDALSFFRGRMR